MRAWFRRRPACSLDEQASGRAYVRETRPLLLCAEANVVAADRLHPRALLTPFTDNVELTRADRKTYTGQAKAQRAKGFQRIDVTFDDRDAKERHQP